MLKNYFKIAIRNLRRRKLHSVVIILGLAVGFLAFTLIMLWIQNQLSYDTYNVHANRIYRVTTTYKNGDNLTSMAMSSPPLATALQTLPQVEKTVRFTNPANNVVVATKNAVFNENNFVYADPTVFQMFTLPLIEGNPNTALSDPYSAVLSETTAKKYFGSKNPVGRTLTINWHGYKHQYRVTSVMKDVPPNSHFHFNVICSFNTLHAEHYMGLSSWGYVSYYTYILLKKNASSKTLKSELPGIIKQNKGDEFASHFILNIQKLTDIHLHSHLLLEIEPNGNINSVYIFGVVAGLILLLAIINFITLSTSVTTDRTMEIGVRKTLGAGKHNLLFQFALETATIILLALIISILLTELTLPLFNRLLNVSLSLSVYSTLFIIIGGIVLLLIGSIYPAIYFSSFQTNRFLGKSDINNPSAFIRKGLVVTQFSIAILLIAFTLVVNQQLHFVMNKDTGFNKSRVLIIPLKHPSVQKKYPVLKDAFTNLEGVKGVTASAGIPGNMNFINSLNRNGKKVFDIRSMAVDYNFLDAMHIHLLSGRNFSINRPTDRLKSIIVNQLAAQRLQEMGLINKRFNMSTISDQKMSGIRVIGVINNINYRPLYYPVQPMVFYLNPDALRFIEVELSTNDISATLPQLKQKWTQVVPGFPFTYSFLNKDLEQSYKSDQRLDTIFNIFSILAIFIACLGLFGLTAYSAEQRTKEIGIRKVLGASVTGIVTLLSKDFLKLVGIGFLIAVPIAWYAMHKWLQNFAYHIHIGVWTFVLAGALAIVIALLTVSGQAIRAAVVNPVDSLRSE